MTELSTASGSGRGGPDHADMERADPPQPAANATAGSMRRSFVVWSWSSRSVRLPVEFDQFSVGVLTTKAGVPDRSDAEDDALQDAHMSHLADLHDAGLLLAAGPLSDGRYRGMVLFTTDVDTATTLMMADPAVQAGWFDLTVIPWMVPGGAMHFTSTTFPRSMAEAR